MEQALYTFGAFYIAAFLAIGVALMAYSLTGFLRDVANVVGRIPIILIGFAALLCGRTR